jgi:hypothetical protein
MHVIYSLVIDRYDLLIDLWLNEVLIYPVVYYEYTLLIRCDIGLKSFKRSTDQNPGYMKSTDFRTNR